MNILLATRRFFHSLRAGQGRTVASFVDDPLKVHKEISFLALRAAILCAIAAAVIVGSALQVGKVVRHIEEERSLAQKVLVRFDNMSHLAHDAAAGHEALIKVREFIPKEENLLKFLQALETLADDTGNKATFRFEQTTAQPSPNVSGYRFITYTIGLSGDTKTFLQYLDRFYALPFPVAIDSVEMQGQSGLQNSGTVMTMKGKVYVQ